MRIDATNGVGVLIEGDAEELRDFAAAASDTAEYGEPVEGWLISPDGLLRVEFRRTESAWTPDSSA